MPRYAGRRVSKKVDKSSDIRARDSRRQESREKILKAAEDQLRKEELGLFSIDRVLDRADVTVGTFYRIFRSKEALLRAVQERLYSRMQPVILDALRAEENTQESLEQAVDHAFGVMIAQVLGESELCRAFMMLSSLDPKLRDDFRQAHIERRDSLTAVLAKHRDEINHSDPDMAIHHAYHLYLATMHGRLAFMRPGAGHDFGISNDVFFDQLKRSIHHFLLGRDDAHPARDTEDREQSPSTM